MKKEFWINRIFQKNHVWSLQFYFQELESDLIALGLSAALSLGGIWALVSGFDDDDDEDGDGTGSPEIFSVLAIHRT